MQPKRSADGYRSLPHKRAFISASVLALIQYLALVAAITLCFILTRVEGRYVTAGFIAAIVVVALSWFIGYFHRRSAKCPLCKGTPLLDSAAAKHTKALRVPPLNYGTTAQISLLMSHRFRCMYCGTGFDLLRKPTSFRD
jgi:uncharacterized membrane protein (DUF485 family)